MRSFAWFLGLLLLALAVMAGLTYPVWQVLHPAFGFPFHRVADRLGMVTLAVGFFLVARRLRLADRVSLGYGLPPRRFLREAALAFAIGVVLMGLDHRDHAGPAAAAAAPGRGVDRGDPRQARRAGLLRGIAVALIEETFLRGAMWTGIARESGAMTATILTSLVYALTHFVELLPHSRNQISWHSGLDMLGGSFGAFARPLEVGDAYICLFAVGVVLATVRMHTGNIAASLGLHAGWVWVITFVRETSIADPAMPLHGLLSHFDGVVGWLVCAWTVLVGFALNRFYAARAARRVGSIGASHSRRCHRVVGFEAVLALLGAQRQQFQQPVAHPFGILEIARDVRVGRRQPRQHLAQAVDQVSELRRHRARSHAAPASSPPPPPGRLPGCGATAAGTRARPGTAAPAGRSTGSGNR